ncbi:hypothetical protein I204_06253 [Kwoniella mangroviensis CBS 8886]|nr:hypothetical protein I204_06253 [Kwoniella mangroviensis CBS 8886]
MPEPTDATIKTADEAPSQVESVSREANTDTSTGTSSQRTKSLADLYTSGMRDQGETAIKQGIVNTLNNIEATEYIPPRWLKLAREADCSTVHPNCVQCPTLRKILLDYDEGLGMRSSKGSAMRPVNSDPFVMTTAMGTETHYLFKN